MITAGSLGFNGEPVDVLVAAVVVVVDPVAVPVATIVVVVFVVELLVPARNAAISNLVMSAYMLRYPPSPPHD